MNEITKKASVDEKEKRSENRTSEHSTVEKLKTEKLRRFLEMRSGEA